jgi:hypothetical protein
MQREARQRIRRALVHRSVAGIALLALVSGFVTMAGSTPVGASAGSLTGPIPGRTYPSWMPRVGAGGRFVAYATALRNFDPTVPLDRLWIGVYLRDRQAGSGPTNIPVVETVGGLPNGDSYPLAVSPEARTRYVLYTSLASNVVTGDTNGTQDVFLFDRVANTTERVSVGVGGVQGDGDAPRAAISGNTVGDGLAPRYVAFVSAASNLVPGDVNGKSDVFLRDRVAGTTTLVSRASGLSGAAGNGDALQVSVSDNGRYVAFSSLASNLVAGDTNASSDVFVRDMTLNTTERVSVGFIGEGSGGSTGPQISADGRFVAFDSGADDLVPDDDNLSYDVFVRDRVSGSTERVSVGTGGEQGGDDSTDPSMSRNGRYIAFQSNAEEFSNNDANISADAYVRDRVAHNTVRASEKSNNLDAFADAEDTVISPEGQFVAFDIDTADYNPTIDANDVPDIYIKDLSTFYTGEPTANAGPDVTVGLATTVTLDASNSSDPEGQPLTFQWQQVGGPLAVIDDKSKSRPQVLTPNAPATLTFRVTVTNSSGKSSTDDVVVTVKAPK